MSGAVAKRDETRFFEHGKVSIVWKDEDGAQVALMISIPCCLMQAVSPVLLGAGSIDLFEVMNPIAVWMPTLGPDRFKDGGVTAKRVNAELRESCLRVTAMFRDVGKGLVDQSDIIPMLPLGVYVTFRLRCWTVALEEAALKLRGMPVVGADELRCALEAARRELLTPSRRALS
jgi:hypothetical protein